MIVVADGSNMSSVRPAAINYALYLILDETWCPLARMPDMARMLLHCGVTCVQLRIKQAGDEQRLRTAGCVLAVLQSAGIPLLINDDVWVAAEVGANGVHLGQQDMHVLRARERLGKSAVIGLSITSAEQIRQCSDYPVDYFGVGPVFFTRTKQHAAAPLGIAALRAIVQQLSLPVVGVGGIDQHHLDEVLATGVAGVAVSAAILSHRHPAQVCCDFAETIKRWHSRAREPEHPQLC